MVFTRGRNLFLIVALLLAFSMVGGRAFAQNLSRDNDLNSLESTESAGDSDLPAMPNNDTNSALDAQRQAGFDDNSGSAFKLDSPKVQSAIQELGISPTDALKFKSDLANGSVNQQQFEEL